MTKTTFVPRGPRDCAAALAYYRHHRDTHPLPPGWEVDATGLIEAAAYPDQDLGLIPYLAFDGPRRRGELSINVGLDRAVVASVSVTDIGRDLLTPDELVDLLYVLLGLDITPAELGEPAPIGEAEYPDEGLFTATDMPSEPEHGNRQRRVVGRSWSLRLPYPFPSDTGR